MLSAPDIEGVSGITSWATTNMAAKGYEKAMPTNEVCKPRLPAAAPIKGLFGRQDGHEDAMNIDPTCCRRSWACLGWACTPLSMLA